MHITTIAVMLRLFSFKSNEHGDGNWKSLRDRPVAR